MGEDFKVIAGFIGILVIASIFGVTNRDNLKIASNSQSITAGGNIQSGGNIGDSDNINNEKITESQTIIADVPKPDELYIQNIKTNSNVNKEIITIAAPKSNHSPYNLTGLILRSTESGRSITIGSAATLPQLSYAPKDNIFLYPGERAYIITGHSPKAYSFRVNKCTGYFEQYVDFEPYLPIKCPYLRNEDLPKKPNQFPDNCLDYIDSIPRCTEIQFKDLPISLSSQCRDFIAEKTTYQSCVSIHKYDDDFYSDEWRIYLERDQILWKNQRENIEIFDSARNVVLDSVDF